MKNLHSKYIFLDVETTSFDPIRGDVISLGAIVTDSSHNELGAFYTTVKPDMNKFISDDALAVSGFSRDDLLTFKPRREAVKDFMWFLKPHLDIFPQIMVSHTVNGFDYRFIDWMFRKEELNYKLYKIIRHDYQQSTIKMARDLGHSNNKLGEWATRLGLTFNHHNALEDARMCLNIHKHLSVSNKL
jgi:DNA polymerase III epsilon subunit-like protein